VFREIACGLQAVGNVTVPLSLPSSPYTHQMDIRGGSAVVSAGAGVGEEAGGTAPREAQNKQNAHVKKVSAR
jgi:hypothetical protein